MMVTNMTSSITAANPPAPLISSNDQNNIEDVIFNLNNRPSRSRSNSVTDNYFSPAIGMTRPRDAKRSSSLGDLSTPSSKQLFFNLISTLNEAFPDYDFQSTKLDQFIESDLFPTMRSINNLLVDLKDYFFFNAQKMKMCYFTCVAKR